MDALEAALKIALKAHTGQKDRAGMPYIFHPLRVMHNVFGSNAKIVALLHDVLEDSDCTLQELKEHGFSREVLEAVDCLTRRPNEAYFDYLQRIAQNPLAVQVKIADLNDNLDIKRLDVITEEDRRRLNKYLKALRMLLKK
ncbi:GTP pyrophosphokinase [Calditrichota bacterium LG25]